MNTVGLILIYAVVSVVPGFFILVFASSGYRSLKQSYARLIQFERASDTTSAEQASTRSEEYQNARQAYHFRRRTFWGRVWGAICRFPPAL